MIHLKKYQEEAVSELVRKCIDLLSYEGSRRKLVFKAPTGAGKTVMASAMLDRLTQELAEYNRSVAIIWIAPNKLHQQSYMRMKSYFTESRVLHPVMYDEIDHSVGGYIRPGDILFVNWESINKDNNVMVRDGEHQASLYDLTRRTQEEHRTPIIVVIDEEHMFGGRAAKQSERVLQRINPKVEVRISATPITQPDELVNVPRSRVVAEQMVKDGITINPVVTDPQNGLSANEYLLDMAVKKLDDIKLAYEKLGVHINPLLLIQLPNDGSEVLDDNERSIIEMVKTRLDTVHGMNTDNQRLAVWLASEKSPWLDTLHEPQCMTRALLFKQAIALGWDCPRAAVLLIFRDIRSNTFGVQTVGRIMRMPEQRFYPDQLLNHGYVYTNLSRDCIEIVADDMNYITKALVATRRENITNVKLKSVYSEYLSADRNRIGPDFKRVLVEVFNRAWFQLPVERDLFSPFEEEADGNAATDVVKNRRQAERIAGIDFEYHDIESLMIRNLDVTGEQGTVNVGEKQRGHYAKTMEEVQQEMTRFCQSLTTKFEKQAALSLRGYIYEVMEEYLEVFETNAPRVILYHKNQPKFRELIVKAIDKYLKIVDDRRKKARQRSFKEYEWEVPAAREYNETTNHIVEGVKQHALLPFIQLNNAYKPELRFESFLEQNKDKIDWWYKNGDEGKQHYAIAYTSSKGTEELFYVDFIIRTKDGRVWLFDTKTEGSDEEAPNKHNALIEYMKQQPQDQRGGVIIENKGVWRYCQFPIETTEDFTGWSSFQL